MCGLVGDILELCFFQQVANFGLQQPNAIDNNHRVPRGACSSIVSSSLVGKA